MRYMNWSYEQLLACPADYVPVIIAGALIVLFSVEHIVALVRGVDVEPSWN